MSLMYLHNSPGLLRVKQKAGLITPGHVTLLPITKGDTILANKILKEKVLPAWAEKVDPSVVDKWNNSVGKVVGFTTAQ